MVGMFRKLRIAFSAISALLCLLLIALWVRSYTRQDSITIAQPTRFIAVASNSGIVVAETLEGIVSDDDEMEWFFETIEVKDDWLRDQLRTHPFQFNISQPTGNLSISVPIWLPFLMSAALVVAPWIRWSKQYSLRTLLVAITVVATVLGAFAFNSTRRTAQRPAGIGDFDSPN
jgi:hypothetical protein